LPTPTGDNGGAGDIAVGPDGNLWFTWVTWDTAETPGMASQSVGRITPTGTITRFPISSTNGWPPGGIAAGSDGAMWFTQDGANMIGQISITGAVTSYPVPTANAAPFDITSGADGNLWFTEVYASRIGIGSNFAGTTSLVFNDTSQPSFSVSGNGTTITTTVPPGATSGPIRIWTTFGAVSSVDAFTVTSPASHIRSVSLMMWGHLRMAGVITTSDGSTACAQGATVEIQRHRWFGWHTVMISFTDDYGQFRGRISDRSGTYRAKVKASTLANGDTCSRAFSAPKHHGG
jgi:hypothetical protein